MLLTIYLYFFLLGDTRESHRWSSSSVIGEWGHRLAAICCALLSAIVWLLRGILIIYTWDIVVLELKKKIVGKQFKKISYFLCFA